MTAALVEGGGLCPRCERPRPACLCGEVDRERTALRAELVTHVAWLRAEVASEKRRSPRADTLVERAELRGVAKGYKAAADKLEALLFAPAEPQVPTLCAACAPGPAGFWAAGLPCSLPAGHDGAHVAEGDGVTIRWGAAQ